MALFVAAVFSPALRVGPSAPVQHALGRLAPARHCAVLMEADLDGGAVLKDAGGRMKKSLANVQDSLSTLRVGRATPSMLDRVEVEYYGAPTPLNQLASVTVSGSQQLVVDV